MVQQSTTQPRGTEKTGQGARTREQQKAVFEGREPSKGIDVDPHEPALDEVHADSEQVDGQYEISSGDRSIQRGANQESEHRKRRSP